MICRSNNLAHDVDQYLASEDRWLRSHPVCACCGDHIQQETAVKIDGAWYCDECLESLREETEEN